MHGKNIGLSKRKHVLNCLRQHLFLHSFEGLRIGVKKAISLLLKWDFSDIWQDTEFITANELIIHDENYTYKVAAD